MSDDQMRGVFVILCTPFDEQGGLDLLSLRRQVRFCLQAGVHGVVVPANASEFWTLSDDERKEIVRLVVAEVSGQIPVVAGVTAGSAWTSTMLARDAEAAGASAVMAMPPFAGPVPSSVIYDYYRTLSQSIGIPIFLQHHEPPMGTRIPFDLIARIVTEVDRVEYIKEETYPPGRAISADLDLCGSALTGVMGGIAGRHMFDEYRRGACGTMPACQWADIYVRIWESLESGDEPGARDTFNRLLPLLNAEAMLGIPLYKEILRRRGVFATSYLRSYSGNPLDEYDLAELDALMDRLDLPLLEFAPA